MKKSLLVAVLLVFVAAVLAAGCGGKKEEAPAPADGQKAPAQKPAREQITIAIPNEPSTLDVQFADDGNMRTVTENISESLMGLDGQALKPIPGLATEVVNKDSTTWEVKLRQGVKFHNGNPFNADDVVFSIKRQIDPALKSDIAGYFGTIADCQKVDDYKVNIITKGPDPTFPTRLTLLKVMDKETVEANPDSVKSTIIGTGPYKLTNWQRGVTITIERFDDYWGTKPAIKTAKYRFIEEDATRAAALKNNEIDLATNMLPEYVKDLPKVVTVEGLEFSMFRLNMIKGALLDKNLRLACQLSVNKEAIASALFQGYAYPAYGVVGKPQYAGFNKNLKAYPYDLEKAKELVKNSGFKGSIELVGERGRWLKDGEQVETVAQMIRDSGLDVKVNMLSFQNWLRVLFDRSKAPDIIFTNHSNDIFDMDRTYSTFVHTAGPASAYPDKLDKLIENARIELDPAKRQQMYEEIGQTIYDDAYIIATVGMKDIYGMQKDVEWQPRQDMRISVWEMK